MWQQMIEYFSENADRFWQAVADHLTVSIIAIAAAVLIGIPAGILCARFKKSKKIIVPLFNVLRVIPSLAVLLLLLPVFGTGIFPASAALVLLGLPPVIINTVNGLDEVPATMIEAAKGCGMTEPQVWLKIKLRLALPLILTGIKTSAIEILASATLAAKIGAGGLGEIIFTGLGLNRYDLLLIGGIAVAALSIATNFLFEFAERIFLKYKYIREVSL